MSGARRPLFILGATGVGKSAVALEWGRRLSLSSGAAVLTMDAMQVYRGADIGTSKATAAEGAEFPHGGLDLAEFGARFDVALYLQHAAEFLREQQEAGRQVLVVGGTGLYFRALTRGLCEAPQGPDELRAELRGLGVDELRARLARIDPGMMARVDAGNPRRLARAIEVMEATGRSLSSWQEETTAPLIPNYTAFWLQREKAELQARIGARIEAMFAQGWIEEVRMLAKLQGMDRVRAFPAIGYGQVAEVLSGETPLQRAKSDILVATRQYAKRQLTWFAREPNLTVMMLSGSHLPELPSI